MISSFAAVVVKLYSVVKIVIVALLYDMRL